MRWPQDLLARVDAWIAGQQVPPPRASAVRHLIELGLDAATKPAVDLSVGQSPKQAVERISVAMRSIEAGDRRAKAMHDGEMALSPRKPAVARPDTPASERKVTPRFKAAKK